MYPILSSAQVFQKDRFNCRLLVNKQLLVGSHFEPHFLPTFSNLRTRLSPDAVPTIFDVPNPPPTIGNKRALPLRRQQEPKPTKKRNVKETDNAELLDHTWLKAKKSIFPVSPQKVNNSKKVEKAFKLLEGLLSQELLSFMKQQVSLCQMKKKGRRYNDSFKALATSIYHISGKAYRFLSKLFSLPSKKTITSTVSRFASGVGFSEKSLYVLKQRIDVLPDAAKTCVLLMDEISLKTHLHYDKDRDCITGLEDLGDGHTSGRVATSALVLMIRGIGLKWKQAVAYYLVNESCSGMHLKDILSGALLHLEELG
eukprot:gene10405-11493_t